MATCPSHGQVSTEKAPAKPIVRQAWGGGRVWESHWARTLGDRAWANS